MILNDWSARDVQAREMQVGLGPCRGKDTAATLGPWLVTADELEPHRDAEGFLRLALRAAEVKGGTCGNGGCLAELWGLRGEQTPPPLKPGNTVTRTVQGLGTVSNTVVPGPEPVPLPRARSW